MTVYTNQPHVKLFNNGKLVGEADADRTAVFTVVLTGTNQIEAVAGKLKDSALLRKVAAPNPDYKLKKEKKHKKSNWV